MPQRHRRFDDTTEHLRDVAVRVLLDRGCRALTLESLSEHGFASIGSVYERWSARPALFRDLLSSRFEPLWSSLTADAPTHVSGRLQVLMQAPAGEVVGLWLVEFLHLARDVPEVAPQVAQMVEQVAEWCWVGTGPAVVSAADRGARWWVIANVIGHAQLRLGGAQIPPMDAVIARLAASSPDMRRVDSPLDVPVEDLPSASFADRRLLDDTAHRVVGVTRRLIAQAGGDASVRSVLAHTGLAAGSLYRRFDSKRALLLGVLEAELASARYDWVQGLVGATRSNDPLGALSAVFRERFDTLYRDVQTRNVILELTAQARGDEALRATVIAQVEHVAAVRAELFRRFADVGLLASDVTPEVCGWLIQCPAAGFRLLVGAGMTPNGDDLEAVLPRVFWNLVLP